MEASTISADPPAPQKIDLAPGVQRPARPAPEGVVEGMKMRTDVPRGLWMRLLDDDDDSLACQSRQWMDAICASGRYTDVSRMYEFDGQHFVLPLVARRVPGGQYFAASLPVACENGGLVGPNLTSDIVAAVVDDLQRSKFLSVHVDPNPTQAEHWAAASAKATEILPKTSHIVDLTGGADDVLKRFSSSTRRNVRRAERLAELEVRTDSSGALIDDYYGLLRLSRTRWADAYGSPKLLMHSLGASADPKRKFEAIAAQLGNQCSFALAYCDGQPVAGIMVIFGRNAYYARGAMDRSLVTGVNPNPLLHFTMMSEAIERGCRKYHLGESGQSEGLMRFKASLGGEYSESAEYRFEKLPFTAADRRVRSTVKRLIGFNDNPSERSGAPTAAT